MKKFVQLLAGALVAVTCLGSAAQDAYPSKPIKMVIPFPPGGAVDTLMRTLGPELSTQLGQPIVIENKPGGGAQIGAAAITTAPADGYTVFVAEVGAFGINPTLYKNLQYQPVRDFDGVAMLVRTPMVMYGSPSGKINSLKSLRDAMAVGENINYGSFGPGTAPHILGHLLARGTPKAKFTHVPYKGAPPAFQAIMANEIDLLFDARHPEHDPWQQGCTDCCGRRAAQRIPAQRAHYHRAGLSSDADGPVDRCRRQEGHAGGHRQPPQRGLREGHHPARHLEAPGRLRLQPHRHDAGAIQCFHQVRSGPLPPHHS